MTDDNARMDEVWRGVSEDELRRIKEFVEFIVVNERVNEYSKLVNAIVQAVYLVVLHKTISSQKEGAKREGAFSPNYPDGRQNRKKRRQSDGS